MMRIDAIGIYTETFQKINQAPVVKKGFFTDDTDLLKYIPETLAKIANEDGPNTIYHFYHSAKEHHYIKTYMSDSKVSRYIAIVSQTPISALELQHLFNNINYAQNSKQFELLHDMIRNPLRFTGKDYLVEDIKKNLSEIKEIMLDNIDKMSDHLVGLDKLVKNTNQLKKEAEDFEKKSRKSCCTF